MSTADAALPSALLPNPASTTAAATTSRVRKQYEALPYPHRNPEEERQRLVITGLDDLGAVNFYCYQGRRDLTQQFRVLVAGGGTGDAVIHLAHQLRRTNAQIVYVDLSQASQDVARKRAAMRGVEQRITWIRGSLLDLPKRGLEPFDYINCSGVLHHLPDPQTGLRALRSMLKDDGALGLMLYGQYGRTGIYQMQQFFRLLNQDTPEVEESLDRAKTVLHGLPGTNWFERGKELFAFNPNTVDAEVYDMFLHSQDRAYTVPQVYEFLDGAGLHFVEHSVDQRPMYDPRFAFTDPKLRAVVEKLPRRDQHALAELHWGSIIKHTFWASPRADSRMNLTDPDNVPYFGRFGEIHGVQDSILRIVHGEWRMNIHQASGIQVSISFVPVPAAKKFISLINDRRTMGEIVAAIAGEYDPAPPAADVWRTCLRVIELLQPLDLILLRHKSVPPIDRN